MEEPKIDWILASSALTLSTVSEARRNTPWTLELAKPGTQFTVPGYGGVSMEHRAHGMQNTHVTQLCTDIRHLALSEEGVVQVVGNVQSGEPIVRECNINSSGRLGGDTEQICGACDERVDVGAELGLKRCGVSDGEEEKQFLFFLHPDTSAPKSLSQLIENPGIGRLTECHPGY